MTLPRLRPVRPDLGGVRSSRLRRRILRCLRQSPLPCSTADLALICAAAMPNGPRRVLQVLHALARRGRVRRLPGVPRALPTVGRYPARWVLVAATAEGGAS